MERTLKWNEVLDPAVEWRVAYPMVAERVREMLDPLPPGEVMTTTDLVERLYPAALALGTDGILARRRMFKAVLAMTTRDLARYASRGPERKIRGKVSQTWVWHAPGEPNPEARETEVCSICGRLFKGGAKCQ